MPRLNGAGQDLRKKRLVGHVRARIDENHLSLIAPQQLSFQPEGGIKASISAAYITILFISVLTMMMAALLAPTIGLREHHYLRGALRRLPDPPATGREQHRRCLLCSQCFPLAAAS